MIFHKLHVSLLALVATVLLAACTGGEPATPPLSGQPGTNPSPTPAATPVPTATPIPTPTPIPAVSCETLKTEFQNVTWTTVLSTSCFAGCHQNATAFSLVANNSAANNSANFDAFKATAIKTGVNNLSLMLTKPAGLEAFHGGGIVAAQGSTAYTRLADMVAKTKSCTVGTVTTSGVVTGTGYNRLRKATLALAGRLPTAAEEAAVGSAGTGDAAITTAIDTQLDAVMNTDANFYVRLKEIYNDMLLTDYYATNNLALGELDLGNFTNRTYFDTTSLTNAGYSSADAATLRARANYGLARSPVELVAYVVANNRPITEIVTADYVMVNSYSAAIFGATVTGNAAFTFRYSDLLTAHNPNVFMPVKLTDANNRTYEHAGILSTLPFLDRYPSTATNRNRARARYTFEFFLDTDVQALADRAGLNFDNVIGTFPVLSDTQCSVCHNVVDPVAGLFKNYNNNGVFAGNVTNWFNTRTPSESLAPGYTMNTADLLPPVQSPMALQFLGGRIALDNRFATATVKTLVRGLMGSAAADDTVWGGTAEADLVVERLQHEDLNQGRRGQQPVQGRQSGHQRESVELCDLGNTGDVHAGTAGSQGHGHHRRLPMEIAWKWYADECQQLHVAVRRYRFHQRDGAHPRADQHHGIDTGACRLSGRLRCGAC